MEGNCYAAFLLHCTPYRLSSPWDCLPADPQAYNGPADPAAALDALLKEFLAEVLIAAGIAQPDAAGDPEIHPFLSAPLAPIIALCDNTSRQVNNLMTDLGCVTGFRYPLFAALLDEHCFRALAGLYHELFLTSEVEDAIILRSLGLAAAPVVGLTELDDYGMNLLARLFGVTRSPSGQAAGSKCPSPTRSPSEEAELRRIYPQHDLWVLPSSAHGGPDNDNHETISLVSWSPKAFTRGGPDAIRTAVQYLRQLRAYRHLKLHDLNLWLPTDERIASVQFALTKREIAWVQDSLIESLDANNGSLDSVLQDRSPVDLATALEKLQKAFMRSADDSLSSNDCKAALVTYQRAIQRDVLVPIARQIQLIDDPTERAAYAHFADLSALLEDKMRPVRERIFAGLAPNPPHREAEDEKSVSDVLSISRQLMTAMSQIKSFARKPNYRPSQPGGSRSAPYDSSPPWTKPR